MKKILAILVAIGLIFTSGAALSVSAGTSPYTEMPAELTGLPGE